MPTMFLFSQVTDVEDHIADLEKVFRQLENGIKIKASKLKLGLKLMPFLGGYHREGMVPDKEKTAAIDKLEYPRTLKELRSVFLGMFAYYRRFIAKFSEIAAPLYEQTKKSVRNPRDSKGITLTMARI